jgi:hypothetical protein
MPIENMFQQAAKIKLRIVTPKGPVAVEDLFDLPLTSAKGLSLDSIAVALHSKVKDSNQISFVDENPHVATEDKLAFDIVLSVIATKKAERAAKAESDRRRVSLNALMGVIESKRHEELTNKSLDELEAMVKALQVG